MPGLGAGIFYDTETPRRDGIRSAKLRTSDPNFSVILPGGCQAKCGFCFWTYERSPSWWLDKLRETLADLPAEYKRCSVSGGEPTLSPVFEDALDAIRARRWDAVILTTNGGFWHTKNRKRVVHAINAAVDHVNLSRHSADDEENAAIFEGKAPTAADLREAILSIHPDVNINCVMARDWTKPEVLEFVRFAKRLGARSVCFRRDQRNGNTEPPAAMASFADAAIWSPDPECDVCKVWLSKIEGMKVAWKSSIPEPSVLLGETYELVYHQNGRLTDDWAAKRVISLRTVRT